MKIKEEKGTSIRLKQEQKTPPSQLFKIDSFSWTQTNKQKPQIFQTNTAEVHAFIVVIISSSADCRTERTIVQEKHNFSNENPSYIFTVSGIIYILYIYNIYPCLWFMSWLMTNNMQVIVARSALSPSHRVAVLVSHISKLKAWMGFRSSGEFFLFFFFPSFQGAVRWGWSSAYDCVLSHCSSLTDFWKVPLGKYSGLNTRAEYRVSWL